MKNLLFTLTILLFASCGDNVHISQNETVETQKDLDALYYFEYGGAIEVTQDNFNRISIHMLDYLTSVNPQNQTLGEHPRTNVNDKFLTLDNKIILSVDVNYTTGDLEQDDNGQNITGKKRTDFEYLFKDGELHLTIKIYSNKKYSNVNFVIAERTFKGVQ